MTELARRGGPRRPSVLVIALAMAVLASGCVHLERASVDASGQEYPFDIVIEDVSYDARFVLWRTEGPIDRLDSGTSVDVYRKDMLTGAVELISVDDGEVAAIGGYESAISDDGDRVVFLSGSGRVMVRTVSAGTTEVAALDDTGADATGAVAVGISGDGNVVAWATAAAIVDGATNGFLQVYRRDLTTGSVTLVSESLSGAPGDGNSSSPSLSKDGNEIAFSSHATDLVAGDTNGVGDVFVEVDGAVLRASTSATGEEADGESARPAIAGDGHSVAFESVATNLHPDDPLHFKDVYRKRDTGELDLVSVADDGAPVDGANSRPSISHDGSIVGFVSAGADLNFYTHASGLYLRDLAHGRTRRGSALADGSLSWLGDLPVRAMVSGDGNYALWNVGASATYSVPDDNNGALDILLRWWSEPEVTAISPAVLPMGAVTTVTVTGSGFRPGVETVLATNLAVPGIDGVYFSNVVVIDDSTITAEIEVVFGSAQPGDHHVAVQQHGTGPGVNAGAVGSCLCLSVVSS